MERKEFSKSQIDRLGDRLKAGPPTQDDLRMLDEYRKTFGVASDFVVRTICGLGMSPTTRSAKSTTSIVEKLHRESIRLSQMQDIAGCRVLVSGIIVQESLVESLRSELPESSVVDRRAKPSHGYRAVHVIAEISGKPIEIQVRTSLQHLWAELSEKSSDVLDPEIKYGGGPDFWRSFLEKCNEGVAVCEDLEKEHSETLEKFESIKNDYRDVMDHPPQELPGDLEDLKRRYGIVELSLDELSEDLVELKRVLVHLLNEAIGRVDDWKRQKECNS